jgi:glutathione S-transferase
MEILSLAQAGGILVGVQYGYSLYQRFMSARAMKRWNNTPKDKVIMHTIGPGKTVPNLSPFSLKLETFLRMAKIDYEIDTKDACWGPTGKFPWISINGQHYGDSQLIIEHLEKKFDKSFNGSYTNEQLAKATAIRVMLEEHFFFGGVAMWRFVFGGKDNLDKIFNLPPLGIAILRTLNGMKIKTLAWYQGIGRNSEEEILQLMTHDLEVVSQLLGENKFILGDEPCRDDCGIFGILAQVQWGMPDSPYQKLVDEKFGNLRDYSIRMKEMFFPDWDEIINPGAVDSPQ